MEATLPPILSPTLPSDWDAATVAEDEIPSAPLSPSLPPDFSLIVSLKIPGLKRAEPNQRPERTNDRADLASKSAPKLADPIRIRGPATKNDDNSPERGSSKKISPPDERESPVKTTQLSRKIVSPQKEIRTPREEPSPQKRHSPAERPSDKVSEKTSNPMSKLYKAQVRKWVGLAQQKKHEADATTADSNHQLAAVLSLDSVVCFIIAFDFDDRAEKVIGHLAHVRSWQSLVPYLRKLATHLESVDAYLAGLCCQACAIVRLHISRAFRHSNEIESSASAAAAVTDFCRGLLLLPQKVLRQRYGLDPREWTSDPRLCTDRVDPQRDRAELPLHVTSSIQEAAALVYHVGHAWVTQEGIAYTWACASENVTL